MKRIEAKEKSIPKLIEYIGSGSSIYLTIALITSTKVVPSFHLEALLNN